MSKTTNVDSPEVHERAVRLLLDKKGQHTSLWQAEISSVAKIGCTPQTLSDWVKKVEWLPQACHCFPPCSLTCRAALRRRVGASVASRGGIVGPFVSALWKGRRLPRVQIFCRNAPSATRCGQCRD